MDPVIQDHIDWFVSLLNGAAFDSAEFQERFADEALAQLSAEAFEGLARDIGANGKEWAVTSIIRTRPNGAAVLLAPVAGEPDYVLQVSVNDNGEMDGFIISPYEPAPSLEDPPTSIEEAVSRLENLAENFAYLVADVSVNEAMQVEITSLVGSQEEKTAPMASMNKLYVLGAVVDAVQAGTIEWNQEVEIVDAYRSLPTGIVQNDPPNTTRTVKELAELMISISDNTATDHLMGLVGRPAVERAVRDYGHHLPEFNEPFLFYREWFILKLNGTTSDSSNNPILGPTGMAYLDADDTDERRVILSQLQNTSVDGLNLSVWTKPIEILDFEWFGSPLDMVNVISILRHKDEEAARILAVNPGAADTRELWSYIGYKGGSEPGVVGMTWYLEAEDNGIPGRVVTGTVWDTAIAFNKTEAILLLSAIRDLSRHMDLTSTAGSFGKRVQPSLNMPFGFLLLSCFWLLRL